MTARDTIRDAITHNHWTDTTAVTLLADWIHSQGLTGDLAAYVDAVGAAERDGREPPTLHTSGIVEHRCGHAERADTALRAATEAARLLAGVVGAPHVAQHMGGAVTCPQADDIARALTLLGQHRAGQVFRSAHIATDEPESAHDET